ncbi:MAG: hypothetical protein J5525_12595 [Lachnospiraceae bacterium]|nr:hypothetical protein [Lachnospiraceae bacterium]
MKIEQTWIDIDGAEYVIVDLNEQESVCCKKPNEDNDPDFLYVMDCENGFEVYDRRNGSEFGYRNLSEEEKCELWEVLENVSVI